MSEDAARVAAVKKFGNIARIKEDVHDVWVWAWWDACRQDARAGGIAGPRALRLRLNGRDWCRFTSCLRHRPLSLEVRTARADS